MAKATSHTIVVQPYVPEKIIPAVPAILEQAVTVELSIEEAAGLLAVISKLAAGNKYTSSLYHALSKVDSVRYYRRNHGLDMYTLGGSTKEVRTAFFESARPRREDSVYGTGVLVIVDKDGNR